MKILLKTILLSLLLISCSDHKSQETVSSEEITLSEGAKQKSDVTQSVSTNYHLKLIKTAELRFETNSIKKTYEKINQLINLLKGYTKEDQLNRYGHTIERELTVRIPSENFQIFIDSLNSYIRVFDTKNIEIQDVSEQYIDVQARLIAKKELESRYLQLLKKADDIKDMIEIEQQLNIIREDVEASQAFLKNLDNKIALSTLNITFYEIKSSSTESSNRYFNRLIQAFTTGLKWLGDLLIAILHLWPFLIIGTGIYIFVKYLKNKKENAKK